MDRVNFYDVGDMARLKGEFTNDAGVTTDPTAVTLKVQDPAGTTVAYVFDTDEEVVKTSVGRYQAEIPVTAVGDWYYRWIGTGAVAAAGERRFVARDTVFE